MQWLRGWRAWGSLKRTTPSVWVKAMMAVLIVGMAFWVYGRLFPTRAPRVPLAQESREEKQVLQHVTTTRDVTASKTLEMERANARLEEQHKQDTVQMGEVRKEVAKLRDEHKHTVAAMQRQHDETMKHLQAQRTQAKQETATKKPTVVDQEVARLRTQLAKLQEEKGKERPAPQAAAYDAKTFNRFEIRTAKEPMTYRMPTSPYRGDTVYLMAGCYAPIKVLTGVPATARTDRSRQIMLSVHSEFRCPYAVQEPGKIPLETAIPIQGAVILAAVQADLSAQRVMGEGQLLTLVMPNASAMERPIKGYLVGEDGVLGMPGLLETHESRAIAMASIYGAAKEAAAIIGVAKSQLSATYAGGPPPGSGMQSTLDKIGEFYLDQARNLQPTLLALPDTWGYFVITEGIPLEGYPTYALVAARPAGGGR